MDVQLKEQLKQVKEANNWANNFEAQWKTSQDKLVQTHHHAKKAAISLKMVQALGLATTWTCGCSTATMLGDIVEVEL